MLITPIQIMKEEKAFPTKAIAAATSVLFLLTLGTFVYHSIEEWSYTDSAYFTTITLTTIGYGDLVPTNPTSKIFTIFFVFSGVGIFIFSLSIIAEHYFSERIGVMEKTLRMVNNQAQKALQMIGPQEEKKITRRDFVKDMIISQKKKLKNLTKKSR